MLRINRLTDYGTLALTHMATHPDRLHSAGGLAAELGLGAPTVSKVLKMLGRRELVRSIRGLRGGYSLGRAPEDISVADIVDALEDQPFGLTECSAEEGLCSFERSCRIRANWQRINLIVRRTLEEVSLADMMRVVPVEPPRTVKARGRKSAAARSENPLVRVGTGGGAGRTGRAPAGIVEAPAPRRQP